MATYREAGVDLEAADELVDAIGPAVKATWSDRVVGGFGGFAAGIELPQDIAEPVIMMSTDGVGTKLELYRKAGRFDTVGYDLVAMCVDDLAAVGARPLGFTDYLAVGHVTPERDQAIIESIARACSAAGVALLGGETAEHPGVMGADAFDLAGAAVGVIEAGTEITGSDIAPGDVIIGVASTNLRSNGFSLVRSIIGDISLDARFPGADGTYADVLLQPSVIFAPAVLEAVTTGQVRGLAHITGGGIGGNLRRVLPDGVDAVIDRLSWEVPQVFSGLSRLASIRDSEMFSTFNMGIGFVAVTTEDGVDAVRTAFSNHGHETWVIGRAEPGAGSVRLG